MNNETSTIVLGQTGVGKSFFMKARLVSTLCGNENASVLLCGNPEEFKQIMERFSGKEVGKKTVLGESAPCFRVLNSKNVSELDVNDLLQNLEKEVSGTNKEVYLFLDNADKLVRSKALIDKILALPKENISVFLTATNVPQSFSDFVFECDSAIVLLKEHSDFSTYAKVLGYNKHQFETEYDQTKLSLKDGTLFTLTRENKNEDFVSKTYCLEL